MRYTCLDVRSPDVNFLRKVMSSSRHDGAAYSRHPCRQSADADIVSAFPLSFSTFRRKFTSGDLTSRHVYRMLREFVGFMAILRYEPCTQFINVLQRALHIYWQFSAMSHAIHKIASKKRCQSYFISRRSPHHGISKDSDLCASAHRCLHYAYARLITRVNSQFTSGAYSPKPLPRIP